MSTTVSSLDEVPGLVGQHLGYSRWHRITQEQVDQFADATGDHQWIHVDPARAAAGPFGGTIAHGYLTLSLAPVLLTQILRVEGVAMGVNYGCNRVRFVSPVPVGAEVRCGATLAGADPVDGGIQLTVDLTVELRDAPKPACVAQVVYRYYA